MGVESIPAPFVQQAESCGPVGRSLGRARDCQAAGRAGQRLRLAWHGPAPGAVRAGRSGRRGRMLAGAAVPRPLRGWSGGAPWRQAPVHDEQDGLRASAGVAVEVAAGGQLRAGPAVGEAPQVLLVAAEMYLVSGLVPGGSGWFGPSGKDRLYPGLDQRHLPGGDRPAAGPWSWPGPSHGPAAHRAGCPARRRQRPARLRGSGIPAARPRRPPPGRSPLPPRRPAGRAAGPRGAAWQPSGRSRGRSCGSGLSGKRTRRRRCPRVRHRRAARRRLSRSGCRR